MPIFFLKAFQGALIDTEKCLFLQLSIGCVGGLVDGRYMHGDVRGV